MNFNTVKTPVIFPTFAPDATYLMVGQLVKINGELATVALEYQGSFDGMVTVQYWSNGIIERVPFRSCVQRWRAYL